MPLTDVFAPNAFNVYSLTSAIQKFPKQPTFIQEQNIFREIPVNTTTVAVEELNGKLALIPTTIRGGAGVMGSPEARVARNFTIPHIQVDDAVLADEVTNVRAFGTNDVMQGPMEVVNRKLSQAARSIWTTDEYLKLGALHGQVVYPTGSATADLNLFTEFGTTLQTFDMDLGTAGTQQLLHNIPGITDLVETALGDSFNSITGYLVLCSRQFFRTFIAHATVQAPYARFKAFESAQPLSFATANRRQFDFDNFRFVEYFANVSGTDFMAQGEDDTANDISATVVPMGIDIYHSYIAPADYVETVGTMGQPIYARPRVREDGKGHLLETQRNVLNICTRPRCLIRLFSSTEP
jgi:hypothetical protein